MIWTKAQLFDRVRPHFTAKTPPSTSHSLLVGVIYSAKAGSSLSARQYAGSYCVQPMRPNRGANKGVCCRAQEVITDLCILWRPQLESQTNHTHTYIESHTDRKFQFLLLCLLLPLAHPRESAETSYSFLQHQVNWNE